MSQYPAAPCKSPVTYAGKAPPASSSDKNESESPWNICRMMKMELGTILLLLLLHRILPAGGVLKLVAPTFHRARMGSDVLIPCTFTIDKPLVGTRHLALSWRFQESEVLTYDNNMSSNNPRASINTERIKDGDVSLYISNATISDGGIYKCLVIYSTERHDKEIRLDIEAPPEINITKRVVAINRQSVLRAAVTGFYPVDINVKWVRDGEILHNHSVSTPQRNPDGTYSVTSMVTIMPTEEDKQRTFSCRVQHESLSGPLHKDFHLISGDVPSAKIMSTKSILNKEQEVICYVWGFYPEFITVSWFLNGSLVESTKTRRINSSALEAVYKFTPTEKNQVLELSCEVGHDTLSAPLVRKLLVEAKDLSVKHRMAVRIVTFLTVLLAAVIAYLLAHLKYKNRYIPKVREITRCGDGTFNLDVNHFHPKTVIISWHLVQPPSSTEKQQLESTLIMSENQDGTFNATSTCEHLRGKVNVSQPYTIQAAVTHPRLKQPVCKEWTSEEKSCYKLTPLVSRPIKLSLLDSGEVLCSLSLEMFYPKQIEIFWSCGAGESQRKVEAKENYKENPDQSYNAESQCKIPGDSLKDPEFMVIVLWKHETMEDWESRELCVRDPGFPWCPNIKEMSPLILEPKQQTTLKCTVSDYFPDVLTVKWFMKDKDGEMAQVLSGSNYIVSDINQQILHDNTYTCTSTLYFTPSLNSQEQEFICQVSHPSLVKPIEQSTGQARMKVSPTVTEPIKVSLCGPKEVLCSLNLSTFYPQNINITWTSGQRNTKQEKSTKKIIQIDDEKTYNALSECRIKWDPFLFPLRVTWDHKCMEKPEYKELRITDLPWIPALGEISVPALRVGSECTMQCDINNYIHDNKLTVTWFKEKKGGQRLMVSRSFMTPALQHEKQQDHTYSCAARVGFVPSYESDHGAVFICRVEHPSLKGAIEKRTKPLHVMVAPVVADPVNLTLCESGEVLCVLTLTRFYPEDITIAWTSTVNQSEKQLSDEKTTQRERDHLHSVISRCRIPWDLFLRSVRVTWRHVSLAEPGHRELHITDFPWRPVLGDIDIPTLCEGSESILQNKINGYFPDALTVTWLKKEKGGNEWVNVTNYYNYKIPDLQHEKQLDHTYSCAARLVFIPSCESDDGAEFSCRVEHPSLKGAIEKSTGPLQVTSRLSRPLVGDITVPKQLKCNQSVTLQCKISKFYPDNLTVTWLKKRKVDKEAIRMEPNEHYQIPDLQPKEKQDHTYSCTASLVFTPSYESDEGAEIVCKVEHPSLKEPIQKRTKSLQVITFPPHVDDIKIHGKIQCNQSVTLQCQISQFYPNNLTVTWLKKQRRSNDYVPVRPDECYKIPELTYEQQQLDHTYSCTARLDVTPFPALDEGAAFICRVEHPSLKGAIEKKTKPYKTKDLKLPKSQSAGKNIKT